MKCVRCGNEIDDALLVGPARCECGEWIAWCNSPADGKKHRDGTRQDITPAWVEALRSRRAPEDKGVGDTFARLLGKGGELFKSWSAKLGIPCGCTQRQAEWNERWPYIPTSNCVVCGKPSTTICSHTLSLGMCGEPLCAECKHEHVL